MKMKGLGMIAALIMASSPVAARDILVTPYVGYTFGGSVEDTDGNDYDLNASESFAVAIETPFQQGRIGLFYSYQGTELEKVKNSADFHYLLFQSSISYDLSENVSSTIGLGLGASYNDVEWVDDKYGWAASAFTGLNYRLSDALTLTSEIRWLGTVVDNNSSAQCQVPTNNSSCLIYFDTDWMNQVSANIGLTWRF